MGEGHKGGLRVNYGGKLEAEFDGVKVTDNAGLLISVPNTGNLI